MRGGRLAWVVCATGGRSRGSDGALVGWRYFGASGFLSPAVRTLRVLGFFSFFGIVGVGLGSMGCWVACLLACCGPGLNWIGWEKKGHGMGHGIAWDSIGARCLISSLGHCSRCFVIPPLSCAALGPCYIQLWCFLFIYRWLVVESHLFVIIHASHHLPFLPP